MDERCKIELKSSYIKLEDEVSNVINLLNCIRQKQKAILDKTDQPAGVVEIVRTTEHNYYLFSKLFSFSIELQTIWDNFTEQTSLCHKSCSPQSSLSLVHYSSNTLNLENSENGLSANEAELVKSIHVLNPNVPDFCASAELVNNLQAKSGNTKIPSKLDTEKSNSDNTKQKVQNKNKCNKPGKKVKSKQLRTQIVIGEPKLFAPHEPKNRFERKYDNLKTAIPDLSFVIPEKKKQETANYDYSECISVSGLESECNRSEIQYKTKKQAIKMDNLEIASMCIPKVGDLGVVSYIHDVSEFYITLVETNSAMLLSEQLFEYVQTTEFHYMNKSEAKLAIEKYCVAYSEQFETWNRAEVIEWNMANPNDVYVQFIDFGDYSIISYKHLRPITSLYCQIDKQALRCTLANVAPFTGEWSSDALRYFRTLCYDNEQFVVIQIDLIKETSNGVAIDFHKANGDDITCREEMVISEYARYEENKSDPVAINGTMGTSPRNLMIDQINISKGLSGITEQDDLKSALDKFCDVLPESYETIGEAILGYNAQDDFRVCKHTRPDLTCYKGERCKLEHRKRRKDGITTDTERVLVAPENTFMPHVNEVYSVMITVFKSPSMIYGQIRHSENGYGALFKEIFKCMNRQEMITSYECYDHQPAVGELVIAKNFDERWYRAVILESNFGQAYTKCSTVKLFYADTGEECQEFLSNVRKMTPGFIIHPYQAMHLRISNIKRISGHDVDAFKKFSDEYVFREYEFTVKNAGASYVNGTFKDSSTGIDLGTDIIQNNFAEANTLDYDLLSSNILVD